ncbi:MAG: antibiotic biosynthesis monooxygenase [Acidimicrobiales bacterium]
MSMITVFRSRLDPEAIEEYTTHAVRLASRAPTMPGYVAHKTVVADDGERVTVVEFETDEQQMVWAAHPEHREAQRLGRERFYTDYDIAVCEVVRRYRPT